MRLEASGFSFASFQELLGYSVHTHNGDAGNIQDLIIEDVRWGVHHVVVALKVPLRSVAARIDPIDLMAGQSGVVDRIAR